MRLHVPTYTAVREKLPDVASSSSRASAAFSMAASLLTASLYFRQATHQIFVDFLSLLALNSRLSCRRVSRSARQYRPRFSLAANLPDV